MTMVTMRKLEVVHKEVWGCLISYNLQVACVRKLEVIWPDARSLLRRSLWMMNHYSLTQSVPYVGIELLWQLTMPSEMEEPPRFILHHCLRCSLCLHCLHICRWILFIWAPSCKILLISSRNASRRRRTCACSYICCVSLLHGNWPSHILGQDLIKDPLYNASPQ